MHLLKPLSKLKCAIIILTLSLGINTVSAEIDQENFQDWNVILFDAIYKNDARKVVDLLKEGVDIDAVNAKGQNAVEFARFMAHHDIAKLLEIYAERIQQLSRGIEVRFSSTPVTDTPSVEEKQTEEYRVFNEGDLQRELAKLNAPQNPIFEFDQEEPTPVENVPDPVQEIAQFDEEIEQETSQELSENAEPETIADLEAEIRNISGENFRTVRSTDFVNLASKKLEEATLKAEGGGSSGPGVFEGFFRALGVGRDRDVIVVERKNNENAQTVERREVVSDEINQEDLSEFLNARRVVVKVEEDVDPIEASLNKKEELVEAEPEALAEETSTSFNPFSWLGDLVQGSTSSAGQDVQTPESVEATKPVQAPTQTERQMVIEVVKVPQSTEKPTEPKVVMPVPVAEQIQPLVPDVRMLDDVHLGDSFQMSIGSNPLDRAECITRKRREFCVEYISWPEDWAPVFDLKTSLALGGTRAIVRYEQDIAASYHVFFESKDYETIKQYYISLFGEPSYVWERKRRSMIKGVVPFEVVAWRTNTDMILEIIQSSDYRSMGLREGHGALRLVDVNDRDKPLNGIRQADLMIIGSQRLRLGL